jgi:hypothetical protein
MMEFWHGLAIGLSIGPWIGAILFKAGYDWARTREGG